MSGVRRGVILAVGLLTATLTTMACSSSSQNQTSPQVPRPSPTTSADASASTADEVRGTVVHLTAGTTVVAVTIADDTAATRSFLAMLPMTVSFTDFHRQEKVATPTSAVDYTDTEGMAPQVGDLFSYRPWGNVGLFYNVDGLAHSDDLVRLGTTVDIDAIAYLEGRVTIRVAD